MRYPHILVVDDNLETRAWLAEALALEGYEVALAADGAEALDQCSRATFDLALVDLRLPGMDGAELMHAIRERSPGTEIVMSTGDPTLASAIDALRQGAHDYLLKSSSPEAIVATIKAALAKRSEALRRKRLVGVMAQAVTELGGESAIPAPRTDQPTLFEAGIKLDLVRQSATIDGTPFNLSPTEFKLLAYLMSNSGRVLPAPKIVREVYGYQCDNAKTNGALTDSP